MGHEVAVPVSKAIIHLQAQNNSEYHQDYHRKLRGLLLNTLPDEYIPTDDARLTVPLSYTGLLPWGDLTVGDSRQIVVSSFNKEVIGHLAAALQDNRDINIGEWEFTVQGITDATADVGSPGSRGTLESDTGTFVTLSQDTAQEYGISPGGDADHYWRKGDPLQALTDRLKEILSVKWAQHNPPGDAGGPTAIDGPLFDQVQLDTTYSIPLHVTAEETRTIVVNKFTLDYEVRSKAHRETLNFALSVGIGEKNSYGLGTLSLVTKQEPVLTGM
jgi:CRISPR-associated endoribonuclease Cas6